MRRMNEPGIPQGVGKSQKTALPFLTVRFISAEKASPCRGSVPSGDPGLCESQALVQTLLILASVNPHASTCQPCDPEVILTSLSPILSNGNGVEPALSHRAAVGISNFWKRPVQGKAPVKVGGSFGSWLLAGVFLLVSYSPRGPGMSFSSRKSQSVQAREPATGIHPTLTSTTVRGICPTQPA